MAASSMVLGTTHRLAGGTNGAHRSASASDRNTSARSRRTSARLVAAVAGERNTASKLPWCTTPTTSRRPSAGATVSKSRAWPSADPETDAHSAGTPGWAASDRRSVSGSRA